jgi:hypothetical protein
MTRPVLHLALRCDKCPAGPGEVCVNRDGSPAAASHMKRSPVAPCGTHGGYARHVKAGESACDACRDARRRYTAAYRERRPEVREKDIADLRARRRAEKRLIEIHRAEFDALVSAEKETAS